MILVLPLPGVRKVEQNTNFGWRRETARVNRITVFVVPRPARQPVGRYFYRNRKVLSSYCGRCLG